MSPRRTGWLGILIALAAGAAGAQQLTNACVVSVENRSAPVQDDGSWVLPGVPAAGVPVRARATCVEDGVTRSGQSGWFTLGPNQIFRVPEVQFAAVAPIPLKLFLSSPVNQLTTLGESHQLTATALYSDGTQGDLTTATSGTAYTTSNPAILEVDAAGVVTARSSGVALIIATNEGAVAILRLEVAASGDSDGDGLPDDWEMANGLDPNDPVDAIEDADGDGLSTADEYTRGTEPMNPDTDGDGLLDGDEVNAFATNPVLRDTDGDQVSDGLELQAGSNPLDPLSVRLNGILSRVRVNPSSVTILFNTVLGEATRQVKVLATLVDGTDIDITSSRYGTTYTSSSLTIVNFGTTDGLLFAGAAGSATVTARNAGFSGTTFVVVQAFAPRALATLGLPGTLGGLDLTRSYAYVTSTSGLLVVDVSSPSNPQLVATLASAAGLDVTVAGDLAYVAGGSGGLKIVDVHNPASPILLATAPTVGPAREVAVAGEVAYVADTAGLRIFDVGAPTAPVLLGGVAVAGSVSVSVVGSLAVVGAGPSGVHVVDVSDPRAPRVVGTTHTRQNNVSSVAKVFARDRYVFVADGANRSLGGLREVDFGNPAVPVVTGATSDAFGLTGVAVERTIAAASDYYFVNSIVLFDVSTPLPVFKARIDFLGDPDGIDVAVFNGLVAVTTTAHTLHIGRYASFDADDRGQPPTVSLTSPHEGDTALERRIFRLSAQASDDVGVARVEFYADDELVGTRFGPPWFADYRLPSTRSAVHIKAVAVDFGGNRAETDAVELTITDDSLPTVELLSPAADVRPSRGATISIAAVATDDTAVTRVDLFANGVLVASLASPPFRADYALPPALTEVTVQATVVDEVGQTATASRLVPLVPDLPPVVVVLSPPAGTPVEAAATVALSVAVSDDFGVTLVRATSDGVVLGEKSDAPYDFTVTAPSSPGVRGVIVTAFDRLGQTGTARVDLRVLEVLPKTTAVGSVADESGTAIEGASVVCNGRRGTSETDGSFELTEVLVQEGRVSCRAMMPSPDGQLTGRSNLVAALVGGVTNVGEVRLRLAGYMYPFAQVPSVAAHRLSVADFDGDGILDLGSGTGFAPGLQGGRFGDAVTSYPLNDPVYDWVQAAADLDGDGDVDFAVVDTQTGRLYVRLSNGDGSFADTRSLVTGDGPVACVAAELTGDALPDLLVANHGSGSVVVLANLGSGAFTVRQMLTVDRPTDLALADFDGDGSQDLAVGAAESGVVVYRGGNGGFSYETTVALGGIPSRLGTADATGDGRPDLVVSTTGTSANLSPADGVATFEALPAFAFRSAGFVAVGGRPLALSLARVDDDADPDLVVVSRVVVTDGIGSNPWGQMAVLRGLGNGEFSPSCVSALMNPGISDVKNADVDGDGWQDFLLGGPTMPAQVSYGDRAGCFEGSRADAPPFPAPYHLEDFVAVDLDGDGASDRFDLWRSNTFVDLARLVVRRGGTAGTGPIAQSIVWPKPYPDLAGTADFNRDGRADAYVTGEGASVLLGDGGGRFVLPGSTMPSEVRLQATTGDFNGDGLPDLQYGYENTTGQVFFAISVRFGTGAGTLGALAGGLPLRPNPAYGLTVTGDFDDDGRDDIVAYTIVEGYSWGVEFYGSNGDGTFAARVVSPESGSGLVAGKRAQSAETVRSIAAADMNGDGKLDVVVSGAVWLNAGGGRFSRIPPTFGTLVAYDFALGDVDGDGDLDVMSYDFQLYAYRLLLNDGTGRLHAGDAFAAHGCEDVVEADVNGDGAVDFQCNQWKWEIVTLQQR